MLGNIEQRCCFVSDSKISSLHIEYAAKRLNAEMTRLINQDVIHFVCSSDHGLNFIAAGMAIALRESHPHITLSFLLPCAECIPHISKEEQNFISDVSREANEIEYLYDRYSPKNMREYARYIIDNTMNCISFTKNQNRAIQLKTYAQSQNRQLIELTDHLG